MSARAAALLLALSGCAEAGHLGTPLLWPVYGVQTVFSDAAYSARRRAVSDYLAGRATDIRAGSAAALDGLWRVSGVPAASRREVVRDLAALSPGPDWVERATIAVMVRTP